VRFEINACSRGILRMASDVAISCISSLVRSLNWNITHGASRCGIVTEYFRANKFVWGGGGNESNESADLDT